MRSTDDRAPYRRKYPRREFSRAVGVLHRGRYYHGRAAEIGEGGMAIVVDVPLSPGDQLVVNFGIPDGDFVSLRAEVRGDCDPRRSCGLAFKDIAFSHKRQIRTYVSARSDSNRRDS